jgi:thymidylate synthase
VHILGDAHIYLNHVDQVREQLSRIPYKLPTLKIVDNLVEPWGLHSTSFQLQDYRCHPAIKAPIAV